MFQIKHDHVIYFWFLFFIRLLVYHGLKKKQLLHYLENYLRWLMTMQYQISEKQKSYTKYLGKKTSMLIFAFIFSYSAFVVEIYKFCFRLMLAECYIAKGMYEDGVTWLKNCSNIPNRTSDVSLFWKCSFFFCSIIIFYLFPQDEVVSIKLEELLKKYSSYVKS